MSGLEVLGHPTGKGAQLTQQAKAELEEQIIEGQPRKQQSQGAQSLLPQQKPASRSEESLGRFGILYQQCKIELIYLNIEEPGSKGKAVFLKDGVRQIIPECMADAVAKAFPFSPQLLENLRSRFDASAFSEHLAMAAQFLSGLPMNYPSVFT